jgi:hypothetical protein
LSSNIMHEAYAAFTFVHSRRVQKQSVTIRKKAV